MFWLFFSQFRFGPKALRLLNVLLRNFPRWKKAMLWAHSGFLAFHGPTVMSRSHTSRSSWSALVTGTASLSLGTAVVAVWICPGRSKMMGVRSSATVAAASAILLAGERKETRPLRGLFSTAKAKNGWSQ